MKLQELFDLINIPITIKEETIDKMEFFHITRHENLPSIMRKGLVPAIGERSNKIGEDRDAIYLFEDKDTAEDALMNWLGDEYDEDESLTMLKVAIPVNSMNIYNIVFDGFSYVAFKAIPPEYISVEEEIL
jgi:hypothetical protein